MNRNLLPRLGPDFRREIQQVLVENGELDDRRILTALYARCRYNYAARNRDIRQHFSRMRGMYPALSRKAIVEELAKTYCLSASHVSRICGGLR